MQDYLEKQINAIEKSKNDYLANDSPQAERFVKFVKHKYDTELGKDVIQELVEKITIGGVDCRVKFSK